MSTATVGQLPPRVRVAGLDALRGLAVLLMVGDHLALLAGNDLYRVSFGRLAMPAFFLLAGHLSGRLHWRHAQAAALGLALPLVVPWVDHPANVLVLWAGGCVVLWCWRAAGWPLWVLVVLPLTLAANGWLLPSGAGYHPAAMLGLMALGAMLPRASWGWTERLPAWLVPLGRRPLTLYVGHLLVLQLAVLLLGLHP